MKFKAKFNGRKRLATGIFYEIETTVEANSPDEARIKLYDDYDHILFLKLESTEENRGAE